MTDISQDLAISLIQSVEQFPVDFDDAWQWIGYSSKQKAKNKLVNNFVKGSDYSTKWLSVAHGNGSTASRVEEIKLTVDCFKSLGMMAGTTKGREVRQYFIDCEKMLQANVQLTQNPIDNTTRLIDWMFTGIKADPNLVQSAKIEAAIAQLPEYKPALLAGKQALAQLTPDEGKRYSPTELGQMYAHRNGLDKAIQPKVINQALHRAGFQVTEPRINSKGKSVNEWKLTAAGEQYGRVLLEAASGSSKTIPVIRWLESVLSFISVEVGGEK